jgi:hypothetical protein
VEQRVFDTLKKRVMDAPTLSQPDFSKPFELETDADVGLGEHFYNGKRTS